MLLMWVEALFNHTVSWLNSKVTFFRSKAPLN